MRLECKPANDSILRNAWYAFQQQEKKPKKKFQFSLEYQQFNAHRQKKLFSLAYRLQIKSKHDKIARTRTY